MDIFRILGGGEPPTPERRRAHALANLRHRQTHERQANDAIPLLQDIRKNLRELTKCGIEDPRLDRARHDMATLVDDLQNFLVMPPPADPPAG